MSSWITPNTILIASGAITALLLVFLLVNVHMSGKTRRKKLETQSRADNQLLKLVETASPLIDLEKGKVSLSLQIDRSDPGLAGDFIAKRQIAFDIEDGLEGLFPESKIAQHVCDNWASLRDEVQTCHNMMDTLLPRSEEESITERLEDLLSRHPSWKYVSQEVPLDELEQIKGDLLRILSNTSSTSPSYDGDFDDLKRSIKSLSGRVATIAHQIQPPVTTPPNVVSSVSSFESNRELSWKSQTDTEVHDLLTKYQSELPESQRSLSGADLYKAVLCYLDQEKSSVLVAKRASDPIITHIVQEYKSQIEDLDQLPYTDSLEEVVKALYFRLSLEWSTLLTDLQAIRNAQDNSENPIDEEGLTSLIKHSLVSSGVASQELDRKLSGLNVHMGMLRKQVGSLFNDSTLADLKIVLETSLTQQLSEIHDTMRSLSQNWESWARETEDFDDTVITHFVKIRDNIEVLKKAISLMADGLGNVRRQELKTFQSELTIIQDKLDSIQINSDTDRAGIHLKMNDIRQETSDILHALNDWEEISAEDCVDNLCAEDLCDEPFSETTEVPELPPVNNVGFHTLSEMSKEDTPTPRNIPWNVVAPLERVPSIFQVPQDIPRQPEITIQSREIKKAPLEKKSPAQNPWVSITEFDFKKKK